MTPGPWTVVTGVCRRDHPETSADVRSGDVVVADCGCHDAAIANAQLIAAAPDLLACLRRMCGMYGAYSRRLAPLLAEDEGIVWTFERANSLALEAVAKAEGRS